MGDEEDGHARVTHLAHDREQVPDLVGIQRRGRLIENQHLGVDNHSAGDGDQLLHSDGDGAQRSVRVNGFEAHLCQILLGGLVGLLPVDAEGAALFVAQHHVLTDGKVGAQVHFLIHGGDTGVLCVEGAVELLRLAVPHNGAGVDLVHTGQSLNHGGLACTVLTHQGVNFTRVESQINTIQGLDAREFNRNAFHYDDGVFICHVFALNENEMLSFCDI